MPDQPIQPFPERLREISLYPAHTVVLTAIGALALCHLVAYLPYGFVLDLLVWVALYKYAFECLRATANGHLHPPTIATRVEDRVGWAQIWLQVVFFALNIIGFLAFGPIIGSLVAIVLALALPGAIMSLAMDENLPQALNPATWLDLIGRIGRPYLVVAGLQFLFNIGSRYAQGLVLPFLPPIVSLVVLYFIAHYALIATFHLMGYLIYQYHEEIGFEPTIAGIPPRRAGDDPDQVLLDEVTELVRHGNPGAARERVAAQLREHGGSEALHAQYRKVLASGDHRDERLRHGREWISALLAQDKDRRAVDVARECLSLDPGFQLAHPGEVARVAQKAADSGASQVALSLVSGFHERHPKHHDIPRNGLFAAKLLAERMGKESEARALLDQLSGAYPGHPLASDIAAYRRFLDRLSNTPAQGAV